MTFEEFTATRNITTENCPSSSYGLIEEAYIIGCEAGKNSQHRFVEILEKRGDRILKKFNDLADRYSKQGQVLKLELEENRALVIENEKLKKNAIVWHKTDCKEPANPVLVEGKRYLVLFQNGDICSAPFWRNGTNCFFEAYDWQGIEAWAELPEVKNADISS